MSLLKCVFIYILCFVIKAKIKITVFFLTLDKKSARCTQTRANGSGLRTSNDLLVAEESAEIAATKSGVSDGTVVQADPRAERRNVLTIRKQLRTLGSTLLPPNAATSPSCRGIWMASWSSRLRWRWSVKPPAPDTCRNKSATTGKDRRRSSFQCTAASYTVSLVHPT